MVGHYNIGTITPNNISSAIPRMRAFFLAPKSSLYKLTGGYRPFALQQVVGKTLGEEIVQISSLLAMELLWEGSYGWGFFRG